MKFLLASPGSLCPALLTAITRNWYSFPSTRPLTTACGVAEFVSTAFSQIVLMTKSYHNYAMIYHWYIIVWSYNTLKLVKNIEPQFQQFYVPSISSKWPEQTIKVCGMSPGGVLFSSLFIKLLRKAQKKIAINVLFILYITSSTKGALLNIIEANNFYFQQ